MKKVTMQQIADQLGISKNSVSLAVRGESGLSDETRELVFKKAEELGYDYKKTNTNGKQNRSIAFIASDFVFSSGLVNRSFFSHIYMSLQQETAHLNWSLILQPITSDQIDTLVLPPCIVERKVDGIIILSHLTDAYTDAIIHTGIPTLVIDHHYPGMQADCVLTNNRFGTYEIVKHLIELGHKEIGFMGNIDYSPSYQERLEGYLLAIKKAGLPLPDEKFIKSNIIETDTEVYTFLGALGGQPTAWFCVNDGLAFYTYSYLQQHHFHIPNDISLTCYDNGDLSRLAHPNITTMDVDLHYYGKCAFNQLLWRMENPDEPYREILLSSTLLKRDSSGRAPE
jgi:LacI family transcriptional regulator